MSPSSPSPAPAGPIGPLDPLVPRPIDLPTAVPLDPGADLTVLDAGKILTAPSDPATWPRYREALARWRREARVRHGEHGERYEVPQGAWSASCYVVAQVWLWDELLYDFQEHRFTPERLLEDAGRRFGGFDGVVLWHGYPDLGLDERNQWDCYREVPGLRDLVLDLQALGVRVFCDFNPWDTGTRRGGDDSQELAAIIHDFGFDGVFLDTLKQADSALIEPLFEANPGLALETESKLALEDIGTHTMSWAQWFADGEVPGVLKMHLYEPRHMQHHVRRWNRDHTEELQSAWLNGVGVMVWEVVFSAWVGWNDRDAGTLRRMRPVQHDWADLLVDGEVTHLLELGDDVHRAGVFATRWRDTARTLVALVNRSDQDVVVPAAAFVDTDAEGHCLVTGKPVRTEGALVPARSVGGVVTSAALAHECAQVPHGQPGRFPYLVTRRLPHARSTGSAPLEWPEVAAGEHALTVRYRCRETGLYGEAPFVEEWKPLHPRLHDLRTREVVVETGAVRVAPHEVTVAEFREFCEATDHDWPGCERADDEPVVRVTLDEARSYARWRGARLPDEFEWQLAMEGLERSGLRVWNWTESEHSDGRSRFTILKGGSDCRVEGSEWYVENGRLGADYSLKYLNKGFDLDRNAWTGFRIAYDEGA